MKKKKPVKDLLGKPIVSRKSKSQQELEKYDRETLPNRIKRVNWVKKIFPKVGGFLMTLESSHVFDEAKMTFINGDFIATLLLANAYIERSLSFHLQNKGFSKEAKQGLKAIIKCAKENELLPEYLLEKADYFRKIRNPFVHLKAWDHEYNLSQRMYRLKKDHVEILENDSKHALSLMYAIATVT